MPTRTLVRPVVLSLILLGACAAVAPAQVQEAAELEAGFRAPPRSARPWVYWFIMDGNFSRAGITADLEAMERAGIGGAVLMEVNVGIPRGPVAFMSSEWRALFCHAVQEAERLGLQITLNAGPGWTGSGGPWVPVEKSMQHLVSCAVEVTGPRAFDEVLPRPAPREPYFGNASLSEECRRAREAFYADVAVLAFPRVAGALRIADIDEKALYVRAPYTSKPGVRAYLPPPPAAGPAPAPGEAVARDAIVDLGDRMQPGGRLRWEVPPGAWTILRFGRRTTGANTRPAPRSGLGFECDKFDPAALDAHFEAFVGRLLETVGPHPRGRTRGWTMLHIDSWEMGSQNWTAGFREMFRRRRGYDPLRYLPALSGRVVESVAISERFLWDLRLTAQELVLENHAEHLKALAHRHGFGLSIEPYDMNPTSDMALGAVADVPMCEFWSHGMGFDSRFSCHEATSIAHTLGRRIVAAEAFTARSTEAWRQHPASMKDQGDWAFCTGINRLVFHRYAHQPWLDRRPGMTMGSVGVHWERTQTWWPMVSAYHRYIARCQYLLRQGEWVADICYLVPEGAPHVFQPPASALEGELGERRGYNFDACAPATLLAHATVEKGRLVLPGGTYRLLVLPSFDTMTPALLHRIAALVEAGAEVLAGALPRRSPSLSGYPRCDAEVASLASTLEGGRIHRASVASAELYPDYQSTARVLERMDVPPDFEADAPIRYAHRRTQELEIYFVASRVDELVEARCAFRVRGRAPQLWDPLTGAVRALPRFEVRHGRTVVPLRFEPHQSFFIVFAAGGRKLAGEAAGRANFATLERLAGLAGPWELDFDPRLGGPRRVRFDELEDWSRRPEAGIRHYSGIATYHQTFDLPDSLEPGEQKLLLDLGRVHSMARVRLNGRALGIVWCAPWRVEITAAVQARGNRLEIEVANLWPNRLIGDQALPPEQRIAWTTWNPFAPDDALLPSGLLGPVSLVVAR